MISHLTIAYMTCRKEPMFEWFADSLRNELSSNYSNKRLVVVDNHANEPGRKEEFERKARWPSGQYFHVPPKPTVWQGQYRLTSQDYFAASNARNTALCLAPDGWIAYVDDVSVLVPGWLTRIEQAEHSHYIVLGAYQKVTNLRVEQGRIISCVDTDYGYDTRLKQLKFHRNPVKTSGSWFFGCSVAAPVEAFLTINGWDEDCDSMGAEDYACGLMLEKQGYDLRYDPQMMTYESEEHHSCPPVMPRKGRTNIQGHPTDAHAYLAMLKAGRKTAPNYFGEGGIRRVRDRVLAGEPFPIVQVPDRDWRDGRLLSEL